MYIRPITLWSVVRSTWPNSEPLCRVCTGNGRATIGRGVGDAGALAGGSAVVVTSRRIVRTPARRSIGRASSGVRHNHGVSTPEDVPSEAPATPHDRLNRHLRDELAKLAGNTQIAPTDPTLLALFDAMAGSRLLDIAGPPDARARRGFLHDRLGRPRVERPGRRTPCGRPTRRCCTTAPAAFFLARSLQAGRSLDDGLRAVLRGLAAAQSDPASGGRHKVFGDAGLAVIPQTSTIASHLPRAVGVAFAIGRARRLGLATRWPPDAVVVCSFGDASINHSTAVGALNTAAYCAAGRAAAADRVRLRGQRAGHLGADAGGLGRPGGAASGHPLPVRRRRRPGFGVPGRPARRPSIARTQNRPALLHLRTVRYLGHAGTDVETGYRSAAAIAADLAHDPLLALAAGDRRGTDLLQRYDAIGRADQLDRRRGGRGAEALLGVGGHGAARAAGADADARSRLGSCRTRRPGTTLFDGKLPELAGPLTLAQTINAALADAMARPSGGASCSARTSAARAACTA